MKKIKKAVIPAAGLGTRFLPATKAQPKEMLPIVDKPTIQYIVEEAVSSGIETLLIITGRSKRAIEDHFDRSVELEMELERAGKDELLAQVRSIARMVEVTYIRQQQPLGLGHAIWCARHFVGNDPFCVLLGDDVMDADPPAVRQLMDAYYQTGAPVLGTMRVPQKDTCKYGIVDAGETQQGLYPVRDLVEKPPADPPSDMAIMGRYVITPDIFEILESQQPGAQGEIQLTDALRTLAKKRPMFALEMSGKRYDVGDRLGFLKATCEFALKRDDLKDDFKNYLKELVNR